MSTVMEKSFFAAQVELRDIDGSVVAPASWTNLQWELRSRLDGSLVESGAFSPSANPTQVAINIEEESVAARGSMLVLEVRSTYTSELLGGAAIARSEPLNITFKATDLISV